jgi:hypothetical protein
LKARVSCQEKKKSLKMYDQRPEIIGEIGKIDGLKQLAANIYLTTVKGAKPSTCLNTGGKEVCQRNYA